MAVLSRRPRLRGSAHSTRPAGRTRLGTQPEPLVPREHSPETLAAAAHAVLDALGPLDGMRVLDAATGNGTLALAAARAGADVLAVVTSVQQAALGHAHAIAEGLRVEWRVGSPELLPVGDDEVHAAASLFGVTYAADRRTAAAELTRVLRPGGALAVAADPFNPWARFETVHRLFFGFDGPELRRHDGFAVLSGRRP